MSPRPIDPEVVHVKLRHMVRLAGDLADMGAITPERLQDEEITRHAAEWVLTQIAQLAASSASYLAVRRTGVAPTSYGEAFRAMGRDEILDADLAERLSRLAGMRNILIHRYDEIDLDLLAAALGRLGDDTDAFVQQMAAHISALLEEDEE